MQRLQIIWNFFFFESILSSIERLSLLSMKIIDQKSEEKLCTFLFDFLWIYLIFLSTSFCIIRGITKKEQKSIAQKSQEKLCKLPKLKMIDIETIRDWIIKKESFFMEYKVLFWASRNALHILSNEFHIWCRKKSSFDINLHLWKLLQVHF